MTTRGPFHEYRGTFLAIASIAFFWLIKSFLKPVAMGAIIATVLFPWMSKFPRLRRLGRHARAGILTTGFAVAVVIPVGGLFFLGADAALEKIRRIPWLTTANGGQPSGEGLIDMLNLQAWFQRIERLTPLTDAQVRVVFTRGIQAAGNVAIGVLQAVVAGLPNAFVSTFVILVTIFFILADGEKILGFVRRNSFFDKDDTDTLLHRGSALCGSVLWASIVVGLVQGSLLSIPCLITGIGNPFLVALIAMISSFLPVVGSGLVVLAMVIMGFVSGGMTAGLVFVFFSLAVVISDNLVRPYVLKGAGELHPLIGFVAAFGALDTLGFYGLFIGPILGGLFFTILPIVLKSYRERA
jgi:predicted PurR-regulated permease PerM